MYMHVKGQAVCNRHHYANGTALLHHLGLRVVFLLCALLDLMICSSSFSYVSPMSPKVLSAAGVVAVIPLARRVSSRTCSPSGGPSHHPICYCNFTPFCRFFSPLPRSKVSLRFLLIIISLAAPITREGKGFKDVCSPWYA